MKICDMLGTRRWLVWSDRECMCGEICDWTNRMEYLEKDSVFHSQCHASYSVQWSVA